MNKSYNDADAGKIYNDGVVDQKAFDTVEEINDHKYKVFKMIEYLSMQLEDRAYHHDDSKLKSPELEMQIEMDKEQRYQYGSQEYFDKMDRYKDFFNHHYKHNRHHPEHFQRSEEHTLNSSHQIISYAVFC